MSFGRSASPGEALSADQRAGRRLMIALVFGILGSTVLVSALGIVWALKANISLVREDYWEAGLVQEAELVLRRRGRALGMQAELRGASTAGTGAKVHFFVSAKAEGLPKGAKVSFYRADAPALDRSFVLPPPTQRRERWSYELLLERLRPGPWTARVELGEPVIAAGVFELEWDPATVVSPKSEEGS